MKVICPRVECEYNGEKYKCKADTIKLTHRNMATINEGRVDMLVCNKYKLSEWGKEVDEIVQKALKGGWYGEHKRG